MKFLVILLTFGLASSHPHSSEECEASQMMGMLTASNTDSLLQKFSPTGCFKIRPSMEAIMDLKQCFQGVFSYIKGELEKQKMPSMDVLRKKMQEAIECKYKKANVIDGNQVSEELRAKFFENPPLYGDDNHIERLSEISKDCLNKGTEDRMPGQAIEMEICTLKTMMDDCEEKGEEDGTLPFILMMEAMAQEKSVCSDIKVPSELGAVYNKCYMNNEKMMLNTNGLGGLQKQFVTMLQKNPTIQALWCSGKELGLFSLEDGTDFDALEKFVTEDITGWSTVDETTKNEIIEGIQTCGTEADIEASMYAKDKTMAMLKKQCAFMHCFAPKLAYTCGFNNDLTKKFFIPFLDEGFMNEFMKSMKESAGEEMSSFKTKMMAFKSKMKKFAMSMMARMMSKPSWSSEDSM